MRQNPSSGEEIVAVVHRVDGIVVSDLAFLNEVADYDSGFVELQCGEAICQTNPVQLDLCKNGVGYFEWPEHAKRKLIFETWTPSMEISVRIILLSSQLETGAQVRHREEYWAPSEEVCFAKGRVALRKASNRSKRMCIPMTVNFEDVIDTGISQSAGTTACCSTASVQITLQKHSNTGSRVTQPTGVLAKVKRIFVPRSKSLRHEEKVAEASLTGADGAFEPDLFAEGKEAGEPPHKAVQKKKTKRAPLKHRNPAENIRNLPGNGELKLRFAPPSGPTTAKLFRKLRMQIAQAAAHTDWNSILTAQFDKTTYFSTISDKRLLKLLRKLGARVNSRECKLILEHFHAGNKSSLLEQPNRIHLHDVHCFLASLNPSEQISSLSFVHSKEQQNDAKGVSIDNFPDDDSEIDENVEQRKKSKKNKNSKKKSTTLKVGDKVVAAYMGSAVWAKGEIKHVYPNNKYAIRYTNGSFENFVPKSNIRQSGKKRNIDSSHKHEKSSDESEEGEGYNIDDAFLSDTENTTRENKDQRRKKYFWQTKFDATKAGFASDHSCDSLDLHSDDCDISDGELSEGSACEAFEAIEKGLREENGMESSLNNLRERIENEAKHYTRRRKRTNQTLITLSRSITASQLLAVLKDLGVSLPRKQTDSLMRLLVSPSSRRQAGSTEVDWKLFLRLLDRRVHLIHGIHGTQAGKRVQPVLNKLRRCFRKARSNGEEPIDSFRLYDPSGLGHVSYLDFVRVCESLGCVMLASDVRALRHFLGFSSMSPPRGHIAYLPLLDLVFPVNELGNNRDGGPSNLPAVQFRFALRRLDELLVHESRVRCEVVNLHKAFQRASPSTDPKNTGSVSQEDFGALLAKQGVEVPPPDLASICNKFKSRHVSRGSNGDVQRRVNVWKFLEATVPLETLVASVVMPQLQRSWQYRGVNCWTVFQNRDPDRTGYVAPCVFREVLVEVLGVRIQEEDLQVILDSNTGPNKQALDGKPTTDSMAAQARGVSYVQFLKETARLAGVGGLGVARSSSLPQLEARLRKQIRNIASLAHPGTSLGQGENLSQAFRRFDKEGKGYITQEDFVIALKDLGLQVTPHEMRQLLSRFLIKNSTTSELRVNFQDFVKFAGFNDEELDDIANRISSKLQEYLGNGVDFQEAYAVYDCDNSGFILHREFREVCRTLQLPITEAELHALSSKFTQFNNKEFIGYQGFLQFVLSRARVAQSRLLAEEIEHGESFTPAAKAWDVEPDKREGSDSLESQSRKEHPLKVQQERLVVDGSNFDGLGFSNPKAGMIAPVAYATHSTGNVSSLGDQGTQQWLQSFATSEERANFQRLQTSLNRYKRATGKALRGDDGAREDEKRLEALSSQADRFAVYDHSSKKVGRMVNHSIVQDGSASEDSLPGVSDYDSEENRNAYLSKRARGALRRKQTHLPSRTRKKKGGRRSRSRSLSSTSSSASSSERRHRIRKTKRKSKKGRSGQFSDSSSSSSDLSSDYSRGGRRNPRDSQNSHLESKYD